MRERELVGSYTAAAHMWPQIWGHYDMLDPSKANVDQAINWTQMYILGECCRPAPESCSSQSINHRAQRYKAMRARWASRSFSRSLACPETTGTTTSRRASTW